MTMPSPRARNVIVWIAAIILVLVYGFAAVPKWLDPQTFAEAIRNYQLVPDWVSEWTGILLPSVELAAVLGLLIPRVRQGAALLAGGMLMAFTIAIILAITRDINIECGCFGSTTHAKADWLSVARNSGLMVCAIVVIIWGGQQNNAPSAGDA